MVLRVNVLNLHAAYDFFQVAKCAPNSKDILVKDDYFRELMDLKVQIERRARNFLLQERSSHEASM